MTTVRPVKRLVNPTALFQIFVALGMRVWKFAFTRPLFELLARTTQSHFGIAYVSVTQFCIRKAVLRTLTVHFENICKIAPPTHTPHTHIHTNPHFRTRDEFLPCSYCVPPSACYSDRGETFSEAARVFNDRRTSCAGRLGKCGDLAITK